MDVRRLLFLCSIAVGVTLFIRGVCFEGIYIATGSMQPTLPVDAHLFLDKVTYRFRAPQRGEIIVFTAPVPPYEEMAKRVIAVGGDEVEIRNKKVILNGVELLEHYIQHTRAEERLKGDNIGPLKVPEGHLFVLGDNRDESDDSTVWQDPQSKEPVYFLPMSSVRGVLRGFY